MKNQWITTLVIVVIVGGLAFFGGMKYQQSQAASGFVGSNGNVRFAGRFGSGRGLGMATVGKVVSSDSNSITVQLQDGSSKIVNISNSTKIVKTEKASPSDLSTGIEVAVFGSTNADGSVTAQNIQINPVMRVRPSGQPQPTGMQNK